MNPITRTHRLAVARAWCGEDDVSKRIMTWVESGGGDDWPIILQGLERLAQLVADAEGKLRWVQDACWKVNGHRFVNSTCSVCLFEKSPKPPEQP